MSNGFYLAQAPNLDYRSLVQTAGTPLAGFMGGIQSGLESAEQLQQISQRRQQFEAEQVAAQQAAQRQEQINALAMQSAAGDPTATQTLMAIDPERALAMQQVQTAQLEQEGVLNELQRGVLGEFGTIAMYDTARTGGRGV